MSDDFNPSPDDFMADPIAHLCLNAARSWGRLMKLQDLEPSKCTEWVAGRERLLIRARDTVLRLRAHESASWIESHWGTETIPGDLMDEGCHYCHSAYLLAILKGVQP